jgi:hypothetical protein
MPLAPICGPEPGLEYVQEPQLGRRNGELSLRDGNHRYEALRRRGVTDFFAIVWGNSAADAKAAAARWANG